MTQDRSSEPLNLGLIYGSARRGRFCDVVGRWTAAQVAAHGGFAVDLIDPQRLSGPARRLTAEDAQQHDLAARIAHADAFIVVTPEYNHGYPAELKALIDQVGEPWRAKPVGFVSYGGISGGLRAVEQLRLVFAELHAVGVRDSVSFAAASEQFDEHGRLKAPQRAERSMAMLLRRLSWWAGVLRRARTHLPYDAVA